MDNIDQVLASLMDTVPGSTVAALLGMDGVAVQVALGKTEIDAEVLAIELASLAEAVQKANAKLKTGESGEFFLSTAQFNFLGAMLDSSYFLVLGLTPDGDVERAGEALAQAMESLQV